MKNKIKKLKLPLNKMTGAEKDYTAVLLEDVNSNMKAFWEVLSENQKDVKEVKVEISEMKEDINELKADVRILKTDVAELKTDVKELKTDVAELKTDVKELKEKSDTIEIKLDSLTKELFLIKEEIKSLRMSLSEKADKEKLEMLELKVIRIEKHLNLSR